MSVVVLALILRIPLGMIFVENIYVDWLAALDPGKSYSSMPSALFGYVRSDFPYVQMGQ